MRIRQIGSGPPMTTHTLIHSAAAFGLIVLLVTAAITDFREFRIPNVVSLGVVLLFPIHVVTSAVAVEYLSGLIAAGIVFAVGLAFFAARVMGGGDVKLLAGVEIGRASCRERV